MSLKNSIPELIKTERVNWNIYRPNQEGLYLLTLLDRGGSQTRFMASGGGPIPDNVPLEFSFPMNPQNVSMTEPAAVNIRPTQNGQFIEHQGQIFKNVTIKGTTGLRPNRVKSVTTTAATNGGIDAAERTGFDDLIQLVNLIRTYWSLKRNPEYAGETLMVWQNGKTAEWFIVEPMDLKTERDASSPLTYKYEIPLRTIERWDLSKSNKSVDSRGIRTKNDSFFARVAQVNTELSRSLARATGLVDSLVSKGARFTTTIFAPVNTIIDALTTITKTSNRIIEIPRARISELVSNITELREAIESSQISYRNGFSDRGSLATSALRDMQRALCAVHSIDGLFSTNQNTKIKRKANAFTNRTGNNRSSGGDDLDLNNAIITASTKEVVIGSTDTIRKVAQRVLGAAGQWKTLVILNNLKAPYISASGDGVNVLRPGDVIKFPSSASKASTGVSEEPKQSSGVSATERAFGRDLELINSFEANNISIFDLNVGDKGDLSTIFGVDNMVQAVKIKFETEEGELQLHPRFGIKYPIGVKALGASSFIEFQAKARSSILSDNRIQDIDSLTLAVDGNVLNINGVFSLKDVATPLSLDFEVKR